MFRKCAPIAIVVAVASTATAQPVAKQSDLGAYAIPFASESNRIELEVVNTTSGPLKDVSVHLSAAPTWLAFDQTTKPKSAHLSPVSQRRTLFTFDLDEKAPVGEVSDVTFEVSSAARQLESKRIKIESEAPTELTLRGNYPNPFNPTTRIAYAIPKDGNVRIEVFNSIGQRVARIVDDVQKAGYQEGSWNAATFPSGVYFYSVELNVEGKRRAKLGKMVLVK